MPAEPPASSADPQGAPSDPSPPGSLPAWPAEPRDQRRPGLALSDLGTIFHTIERLTLKLSRLKVRARPGLPAAAPSGTALPASGTLATLAGHGAGPQRAAQVPRGGVVRRCHTCGQLPLRGSWVDRQLPVTSSEATPAL